MRYTKQLPKHRDLERLSTFVVYYPAAQKEFLEAAQTWGMGDDVIELIKQFPSDEIFDDRYDFLNRCDELELIVQEERDAPRENVQSYED